MFKLANSLIQNQYFRLFHSSISDLASCNKQGKVLNKLMFGSDKNKRRWYGEKTAVFTSPMTLASTKGQGKESIRRLTVLNKLFMQQITDLMATGEYSEAVVGYGIQISRVRVTSDFHGVNVFWFAIDTTHDSEIGRLLKRVAGGLRHELSQLRLIGQVPKLTFVKDKTYGLNAEVNSALLRADYGDDYVPDNRALMPNTENKFETILPPELQRDIDKLEYEIQYPQNDHDPLPDMRHDVLGLDHGLMMNKIKRSLNKSKSAWTQYSEDKKVTLTKFQCADAKAMDKGKVVDTKLLLSKSLERQKFRKHNNVRKFAHHDLLDYNKTLDEEYEIEIKDDDILDDNDPELKR